MNKHHPFEDFKPGIPQPFSQAIAHNCLGEVRPSGRYYTAVALIHGSFPIFLGTFIFPWDACAAIIEAHGGEA